MHPLVLKLKRWQFVLIVACIASFGVGVFLSRPKVANPPIDTRSTFDEALAAQEAEDYERAIELYSQYLAANPNAVGALKNRADCYGAAGDFGNLERDAERVLEIDASNLDALKLLVTHWLAMGDNDTARKYALRLLEVDPGNEVGSKVLGATGKR